MSRGKDLTDKHRIVLKEIMDKVVAVSGIPEDDIVGKGKARKCVSARCAFIYIAYRDTPFSYGTIGRYVNRDHASVMHSYSNVQQGIAYEALKMADEIDAMIDIDYLDVLNVSFSIMGLLNYHMDRSFDFGVGLRELAS